MKAGLDSENVIVTLNESVSNIYQMLLWKSLQWLLVKFLLPWNSLLLEKRTVKKKDTGITHIQYYYTIPN